MAGGRTRRVCIRTPRVNYLQSLPPCIVGWTHLRCGYSAGEYVCVCVCHLEEALRGYCSRWLEDEWTLSASSQSPSLLVLSIPFSCHSIHIHIYVLTQRHTFPIKYICPHTHTHTVRWSPCHRKTLAIKGRWRQDHHSRKAVLDVCTHPCEWNMLLYLYRIQRCIP